MTKEELEKKFREWALELNDCSSSETARPSFRKYFIMSSEEGIRRGWDECMKWRLNELKSWDELATERFNKKERRTK